MRQNDVAIADIYLEHSIGQGFDYRALEFDYIVFCQSKIPPKVGCPVKYRPPLSESPVLRR